jgi:hypothetical protein
MPPATHKDSVFFSGQADLLEEAAWLRRRLQARFPNATAHDVAAAVKVVIDVQKNSSASSADLETTSSSPMRENPKRVLPEFISRRAAWFIVGSRFLFLNGQQPPKAR